MIFWFVFGALYVTVWAVIIFLRAIFGLIVLLAVLVASIVASFFVRSPHGRRRHQHNG